MIKIQSMKANFQENNNYLIIIKEIHINSCQKNIIKNKKKRKKIE